MVPIIQKPNKQNGGKPRLVSDLIQLVTEGRLRHASGPAQYNSKSITLICVLSMKHLISRLSSSRVENLSINCPKTDKFNN